MTRYADDDEYGDWLFHKCQDDALDFIGVIAKPAAQKLPPACQAAPQWKPTFPGEQPPF